MMGANKDIAGRQRHVFGELMLNREVCLVRVGIFEVLLHWQRKRQHWTKAGKCLVVKSLATKLILRPRSNTRSHDSGRTNWSNWSTWWANSSLEYLHGIKQRSL